MNAREIIANYRDNPDIGAKFIRELSAEEQMVLMRSREFRSLPSAERIEIAKIISRPKLGLGAKIGCLFGALGAVVGVSVAAMSIFAPHVLTQAVVGSGAVADSRPVPGKLTSFDPIAAYAQVSSYAGADAWLLKMDATNVRSDGTLDLSATYEPAPNVRYTFARPAPAPKGVGPIGVGNNSGGAYRQELILTAEKPMRRTVTRYTNGTRTTDRFQTEGLWRDERDPESLAADRAVDLGRVASPTCSLATLWKVAVEHGVRTDAVARVTYDTSGYSFRIAPLDVRIAFDAKCQWTEGRSNGHRWTRTANQVPEPDANSLSDQQVDSADVAKELRKHVNALTACYELHKQGASKKQAKMTLALTLTPAGKFTDLHWVKDTLGDSAVSACMTRVVSAIQTELRPASEVQISYPFIFD